MKRLGIGTSVRNNIRQHSPNNSPIERLFKTLVISAKQTNEDKDVMKQVPSKFTGPTTEKLPKLIIKNTYVDINYNFIFRE